MQVAAVALEHRALLEVDHHIEIARRAAVDAGFAFAGQTDAVPAVDASGNLDRQRLVFLAAAFAMAAGAGVGHHLAGAATARAGLLHREKALLDADLPVSTAGGAGCRLGTAQDAADVTGTAFLKGRNEDLGI